VESHRCINKSCDALYSLDTIIMQALVLHCKAHMVALNISRDTQIVFYILIQPSDALVGHFLEHLSWVS